MDKHGVIKPIWVTETSTSSYDKTVLSEPGTEGVQANHVLKRLVVFTAKGAEKVLWYDYGQLNSDDKFYGCSLIGDQNRRKPAYYTFRLVVDKLGNHKTVNRLRGDSVWLYEFTDENDEPIFVAWSSSAQIIDLSDQIETQKVLVTHIIEDNSVEPEAETAETSKIHLTTSPIFIEIID